MEPILANTNLDNQFIFSLFVSNELIVLESVNQMSRLCELSLTECCHQLLKLREFIGLTGTRQRAIQSRIVIDMNKEDIIHESTCCHFISSLLDLFVLNAVNQKYFPREEA